MLTKVIADFLPVICLLTLVLKHATTLILNVTKNTPKMRIKFLILLIGISLNSLAQDSMLLENSWYLEDLVINNESNLSPTNNEITNIRLEFFAENNFVSIVCESLSGTVVFDDVNNNFTFTELYESLGGRCSQTSNSIYERIYFNFYYNSDNHFDYSILVNENNSKTLTITSLNGDQAIYGSDVLSIVNKAKPTFSLFYNTVSNSIDINSMDFLENFSIKLFDSHGKLVFDQKYIRNEKSINIQNLPTGIYFVILQSGIDKVLKKKIIKY